MLADAAPASVRDQVMDHFSNAVQYYIDREVRCDTQAAYLGRPSNEVVQKMARLMSLNVDPTAPTKPSDEQLAQLVNDRKIIQLSKQSKCLTAQIRHCYGTISKARGTKLYNEKKQADANLNRAKTEYRAKAFRKARKKHFRKADTLAIDQQFNQSLRSLEQTNVLLKPTAYELKERGLVVRLTCDESDLIGQEKIDQRIKAVAARAALCDRQESQRRGRPRFRPSPEKIEDVPEAKQDIFPMVCQPRQCIFCIGDESKSDESRLFSFCTVNKMRDHVESIHLQHLPSTEVVPCEHPFCKPVGLVLSDKQVFKNHVQRVHGISLRA